MINGDGPGVGDKKVGVKWSHGEGFGAGATDHGDWGDKYGKPGVIIIEFLRV